MAARLCRRSFLKAGAVGFGAMLLPRRFGRVVLHPAEFEEGRVADFQAQVYAAPSFSADRLHPIPFDSVFRLAGTTLGGEVPEHNRVWYLVEGDGFIHSSGVQPVRTALNAPLPQMPPDGVLAEVSVPWTDARWGPGENFYVSYRLYYSTVHWLAEALVNDRGESWYRLWDDGKRLYYWARSEHLRPIAPEDLAPLSPDVPPAEKRLVVDRGNQWLMAFEGERSVFMTRVSTGRRWSTGDFRTPPGAFKTRRKRPTRHMAGGDLAAEDWYDLPGVPWVTYFNGGIAFHGTYWHNDFGRPRSHGCVNLTPDAARWVYRWTLPVVPYSEEYDWDSEGTRVEVH